MIFSELFMEKKKIAEQNMPELTEALFEEYFISGNRLRYEEVYFSRRKFLTVYGIIEEESEADIKKLENILFSICNEKTWALPPHVNRESVGWEYTLDLFSTETAFALAEIIMKKGSVLSMHVQEMVKKNVMMRCLTPFINAEENEIWWENVEMNWCAVCNSCIGAAGLYLLEEGEEKERFLNRIINNLTKYLQAFSKDGVCLEGLDYFNYAMGHIMLFWDLLESKTNYHTNWEKIEQIDNIFLFPQKCILSGGFMVSFSDTNPKERLRLGVQGMMNKRNKNVWIPKKEYAGFYADSCFRYGLLSRDIIFERKLQRLDCQEIAEIKCQENFFWDAQWFVFNNKYNQSLAVKGGNNAEPHNHNDIGSLLFISDSEMLLSDIGAGEYTKKYFDIDYRYQNFCCRAAGHNIPLIDGKEQICGEEYFATDLKKIRYGVSMNLKYAYPKEYGICTYLRKVYLKEKVLIIEDVFEIDHIYRIEENFVSELECEIRENAIILNGKENKYIMKLIHNVNDCQIKPYVECEHFSDHGGVKRKIYRFGFSIKECKQVLRLQLELSMV